jgi:hypothetical protein
MTKPDQVRKNGSVQVFQWNHLIHGKGQYADSTLRSDSRKHHLTLVIRKK